MLWSVCPSTLFAPHTNTLPTNPPIFNGLIATVQAPFHAAPQHTRPAFNFQRLKMIKSRKIDFNDSNVAALGSDLDKKVRARVKKEERGERA